MGVALSLSQALARPHRCRCDCHRALSPEERIQGVAAMYRFDDAMRGWGYTPLYEPRAHGLFAEAKAKNDPTYRFVAVRDEECIYRRLVGFAVHELIHLFNGDPTQANYGIPWGLPYGVPEGLPEGEEAAYLEIFNRGEARAWVGVGAVSRALFGIGWTLRTARDVGTYGFPGGNAIVDVPPGFRPVPHWDRLHHPQRYYALARRLEEEELAWFTDARLEELRGRFAEAEARGRALLRERRPDPAVLARLEPQPVGRNDLCPCGSGRKFKRCCGGAVSR